MRASTGRHAALIPSLAVAGSAVMWGLWWIPLRALDARGLAGDWASLALFAAATLLLLPLAWLRRAQLRDSARPVLVVGVFFGSALVAWNHALIMGDVVRVTLLFYMAPVWGTLLAILMLRMRPSALRLVTIVLGLGGAAVVLGFEDGVPLPRSLADWMGLMSGLLFAAGALAVYRSGHMGDIERTIATFALSALFALLLAGLTPVSVMPQWTIIPEVLPLLLAVSALWYLPLTWLMIWGAARLDPGRVTILLMLEVGVASLSAGLLTDEPFGWREVAGGLLILGAGALESYDQIRRSPAAARG